MLQDFANQVYWWKDYAAACRKAGKNKGVFATPDIAERMAGQVYMFYLLIVIIKTNMNKLTQMETNSNRCKDFPGVGPYRNPWLSKTT